MDKKLWVFLLSVGLFGVSLFSGGDTGSASVKKSGFSYPVDNDSVDVYFFYGEGCPHCADVQPFLAEMEKRYRLNLQRFDIYTNRSHISLFDEFSDDYGLPSGRRGVPAVFISGTYFVGDTMILEDLEDVIEEAIVETTSVEPVEVAEDSMEAQAANEDARRVLRIKKP
jgi:thiol-disulfide isomerase/thioredoxin